MKIIEQVKEREPFFDGWETEKVGFTFRCDHCRTSCIISFKEILDAAWGWKESMAVDQKKAVALAFGIDLDNRNIGNGMNAVVTKVCANCKKTFYVFFWFHEYRHSCYQISLRGLAEE
ncbi:MAG: hypothetical protein R6U89_02455 [Dehalococcoidia bacterium]